MPLRLLGRRVVSISKEPLALSQWVECQAAPVSLSACGGESPPQHVGILVLFLLVFVMRFGVMLIKLKFYLFSFVNGHCQRPRWYFSTCMPVHGLV